MKIELDLSEIFVDEDGQEVHQSVQESIIAAVTEKVYRAVDKKLPRAIDEIINSALHNCVGVLTS